MKSIIMSFSPYWYYLIMEGIKTIEVRKTIPQAPDWGRRIECYMTKDKKSFARIPKEGQEKYRAHMGKVGMRFMCDMVYNIRSVPYYEEETGYKISQIVLDGSCLFAHDIITYLTRKDYRRNAYGLHVSDLKIYDKPKELGEFKRDCGQYGADHPLCDDCKYFIDGRSYAYDESDCAVSGWMPITRPPQSWCYGEQLKESSHVG